MLGIIDKLSAIYKNKLMIFQLRSVDYDFLQLFMKKKVLVETLNRFSD